MLVFSLFNCADVADGADAKEQNPTGLEMLTSAELDYSQDRPNFRPKSPPFGLGWAVDRCPAGQRRRSLYLQEQLARFPYQFSNVRAFRNSLASVAAMLKRVLVASRGA
jgi:hypothetical protein